MTGKGWTTQVAAAAGAAAGTGAAQLGLGYGLGVVVWPATPTTDDSVWLGSLGWATWIAASATVFGAVIAARLRGADAPRLGGPWRFALAASAAVGALLTVALVAVPARPAVRPDTFAPEMIAGGYAVIGVVLGLIIAYWAVVSRAVAANLIATAGYLWTLAAAGIVVELTLHRESATYLTSWQFAELGAQARYGTIYWPSALLTLLAALVIGMIAAWPSVRGGNLGIGAASSGAVGPLLVAASFLVLAPQLTGALGQLQSAYLIAPYAVLAGLAGSALIVAAGQRSARRRAARVKRIHRPAPPPATGKATVPDTSQTDTPPMGLPQVSAATPTRRGGRAKSSAASRPGGPASTSVQTPDQARESAASRTAGPEGTENRPTSSSESSESSESSDRRGRWSRLRRGGRATPSAPVPAPSAEPAPSSSRPPTEAGAAAASKSASGASTAGRSASGRSGAGASSTGASAASGSNVGGSNASAPRAGAPSADDPAAPARAAASGASPAQGRSTTRATTPAASPAQGRPTTPAAPITPPSPGRSAARAADPASAKGSAAESTNRPRTSKSTVAAPPSTPPIAKINPPVDTAAQSGTKPDRPSGKTTPPKASPSKATPPAKSTPPKPWPDESD